MRLGHIILKSNTLIVIKKLKYNEENVYEFDWLLSSILFSLEFLLYIDGLLNKPTHFFYKYIH